MLVLWIIHLLICNAAIVDVGWAAGLAVLAFFYATGAGGYAARKWAMASMVGFWGLRLAAYLLFARVISKPEEGRYLQLRKEWKTYLPFRFLFLFEFQAALVVVLSLPFLVACVNPAAPLARIEKIGAGIWLLAMIGEAIADEELNRFKKNPANKGKTLRTGLWKYSRHPNYFFEWLHWWAYVIMGVSSPGWLLTWIGPIGMGWALLKVTGIPWTERQALASRGEDYREYQRTTNAFFPWFPRGSL